MDPENIYSRINYKVMMVGTELKSRGGVAAVVNGYYTANIMSRLKIDYYPTHCDGKRLSKIFFYLKGLLIIIIKIYRYKIIHVHMASKWSFRRLFLVLTLAEFFKKKRIIHIHGGMFNYYYSNASNFEKSLIRYTFSKSHRVIVLYEKFKEKIEPFCDKDKIVVIPNTVPMNNNKKYAEIFSGNPPRLILFLGHIFYRKGVYDLIKALSYIKDQNKFRACICGTGEIQKAMDRIVKYGLEKQVTLVGWVNGDKKNNLLQEAYLCVLPSFQEGLPMSILEAMAAGNPVVSTPVGGIPDVVKDGINGFLVPPGHPHLLADRIKRVIDNPSLWEKLSKNAQSTIESHFSIKKTEKTLHVLYRSLVR